MMGVPGVVDEVKCASVIEHGLRLDAPCRHSAQTDAAVGTVFCRETGERCCTSERCLPSGDHGYPALFYLSTSHGSQKVALPCDIPVVLR